MQTSAHAAATALNQNQANAGSNVRATDRAGLEAAIGRLRAHASAFARLSLDECLSLATAMQQGALRVAERSVRAGCEAKGITLGTPAEAEEWATGPWAVVRHLRLIRESLNALKTTGNTPIGPISRAADGRLSVRCFPGNRIDSLLFKDVTVDVRMQAGVTEQKLDESRAGHYKKPLHDGVVALVLGAGNIASIPAMDVITKMFNERKVCLLKMSPVNAYLGPFIEDAFSEAIAHGYLAVVYGGAEEGAFLSHHAGIDEVHVTGSARTHDIIVWGPPGPERAERMRHKQPVLDKPITSELGNISPVIVVPGPYTDKELQFQAEDAASYMVMNASFFCNAAKMLVLPDGWDGSERYLEAIKQACAKVPPRKAYYPGANERWRLLTAGRRNVETVGKPGTGSLPWTFVRNLDPGNRDEALFREEPFCSLLSEVRIGSRDPVDFLRKAVDFCNDVLWGTLSATLVVHPKTLKDPVTGPIVENAIARLRYGTVAVNGFSGLSFVFAAPPWGAYPGSTLDDIQSGQGFVHNTGMLEGIEKVVMRYPLTAFPKPGYHLTHRTAHRLLPRLTQLEENASWAKLPAIMFYAMGC